MSVLQPRDIVVWLEVPTFIASLILSRPSSSPLLDSQNRVFYPVQFYGTIIQQGKFALMTKT
ncbi:MAG: hypothetical protein JWM11_2997 [Planctomycetaceae bacterium]|nr:hypothetical protein [Planctomycetaceae bacterium]